MMLPAASRQFMPPPASQRPQFVAELLRIHERARALGAPLLTEAGVVYLREWLPLAARSGEPPPAPDPRSSARGDNPLPYWDADCRRLWLGEQLLKEFRQPAPNQTTLLDVFQEQGWVPSHIDDPLSRALGESEKSAKRRLHETISNLNRGLPTGTIRFRGDGTGQGIVWEYDRVRLAMNRPGHPTEP